MQKEAIFPKSAVRPLRESYRETQLQFASRLGVTQGAVSRWENPQDDNAPCGPAAIMLRTMAKRKKLENFA